MHRNNATWWYVHLCQTKVIPFSDPEPKCHLLDHPNKKNDSWPPGNFDPSQRQIIALSMHVQGTQVDTYEASELALWYHSGATSNAGMIQIQFTGKIMKRQRNRSHIICRLAVCICVFLFPMDHHSSMNFDELSHATHADRGSTFLQKYPALGSGETERIEQFACSTWSKDTYHNIISGMITKEYR